LFGLIMVLTLTRTFNVSETYRSSVRTLLMDALIVMLPGGSSTRFFIS
jgi:hypothetical protein